MARTARPAEDPDLHRRPRHPRRHGAQPATRSARRCSSPPDPETLRADRPGLRRQGVHGRGLRLAEVDLQDARLAAGHQEAEEADHGQLRRSAGSCCCSAPASPRCAGPGACPSRCSDAALKLARAQSSNRAMRLRLPSHPALPMPRRITLRWKLAGLLIFIAVLRRGADHGQPRQPGQGLRRRAAQLHAGDPAARRARQRAGAGQRERGAGRPPHPRGHARDQAPARAAHPGQRPPDRARARRRRAHLHHRAGAQERALPASATSPPTAA